MPLKQSASEEALRENIAAERRAGKPEKQAVAIAYSIQRRNKDGKMHVHVHMRRKGRDAGTAHDPHSGQFTAGAAVKINKPDSDMHGMNGKIFQSVGGGKHKVLVRPSLRTGTFHEKHLTPLAHGIQAGRGHA